MTAADLLALRPGTDGDGFDLAEIGCFACDGSRSIGHFDNCANLRLSAALTAGAQAMERWEKLAEWIIEKFSREEAKFIIRKIADLERGEP